MAITENSKTPKDVFFLSVGMVLITLMFVQVLIVVFSSGLMKFLMIKNGAKCHDWKLRPGLV